MKAWCAICGRQVPPDYDGKPGRCPQHYDGKRLGQGFVSKRFEAMRALVDTCPAVGKVFNDGKNYWTELEARAAREQKRQAAEDRAEILRQRDFLQTLLDDKKI